MMSVAELGREIVDHPEVVRARNRALTGARYVLRGTELLLRDRDLAKAALVPVFWLVAFGVVCALADGGSFIRSFYKVMTALAPVPSILFARKYARLAAAARVKAGFLERPPHLEGLRAAAVRALMQTALIAIAIAPVEVAFNLLPLVGHGLARVPLALWALHWIVVDSLDSARVADAPDEPESAWFVRGLSRVPWLSTRLPWRKFVRICDRLSRPFREEAKLVAEHPMMFFGFGLAVGAILALPFLDVLFRPIAVVAAAIARAELEG